MCNVRFNNLTMPLCQLFCKVSIIMQSVPSLPTSLTLSLIHAFKGDKECNPVLPFKYGNKVFTVTVCSEVRQGLGIIMVNLWCTSPFMNVCFSVEYAMFSRVVAVVMWGEFSLLLPGVFQQIPHGEIFQIPLSACCWGERMLKNYM